MVAHPTAEIGPHQAEVRNVNYVVPVEIGPRVVRRCPDETKRALQDVEVHRIEQDCRRWRPLPSSGPSPQKSPTQLCRS